MPRIADRFSDCVVYVYGSLADATAGERTGGSGFIVAVPLAKNPTFGTAYVITNRHVVMQARTPVIRVNRTDGAVEYFETTEDQWIFHPESDDVAAYIFESEFPEQLKTFLVLAQLFLTPDLVEKEDVGIGDETFMLGRLINHEGKQRNAPAIRFGNIAMMPKEKIVGPSGLAQESFLVETRSLPGYSGSPVFLYSLNTMMDFSQRKLENEEEEIRNAERTRLGVSNFRVDPGFLAHMTPKGPYLLGIDWCHLNTIESVCEKNGERLDAGWIVKANSGMAGVIPAWKIAELLDLPELVENRRIDDEKVSNRL